MAEAGMRPSKRLLPSSHEPTPLNGAVNVNTRRRVEGGARASAESTIDAAAIAPSYEGGERRSNREIASAEIVVNKLRPVMARPMNSAGMAEESPVREAQ